MIFKMYNRVFQCYVTATAKLYCNGVVYPLNYKFQFSAQNHALLARAYCTNKSLKIVQDYEEMYEKQLNEKLKDPNFAAKYNKCKLEVEDYRSRLFRIPEVIKPYDWLVLLETDFKGQRRTYLEYRWKTEMKQSNDIKRREIKKKRIEKKREETGPSKYSLSHNTLFYRIRDQAINHFYNGRLMSAMLHSPPIVLDFSYDQYMSPSERQLCAKQLLLTFSENRVHDDPCNLYFCNVNRQSITMQKLHITIPTMYDPDFPLNITSKSYLEIFDKSRLVYLTPDSNQIMTHYDPNSVYIIGALVDKVNNQPCSAQKARREGIKMVRLPLAEKLQWGIGSTKTLPLNHMLSILLDLKYTNDWNIALQHIPRRKLKEEREKAVLNKFKKRQELIESLIKSN
ncbi:mitochondrial ribonuclease P protein 1 homolog [Osmia bicornis bicornis]|uniref:mitochondrial ribonuclease P protein 1 homolog n=1 Tax=Osmia bicornis bicornis TaxID=1437191 RepID=UPI001EAEF85B|nr:mitochondrial ribonuclease P protein 1 homolog [Osmia bicornis bicornis]